MWVKSAVLKGGHGKASLGVLTLFWLEECREWDKIKNKGHGVEPKAGGEWGCQDKDPRGEAEARAAWGGEGFGGT